MSRTNRLRRFPLLQLRELEDRATPATFTVTTTADSGPGSLRQAISDANGNTGADTIQLTVNGTIAMGLVPYQTVSGPTSFVGPGSDKLAVTGNANRILIIANGTAVTISGLSLSGGSSADDGGAIFNSGTLTLAKTTLSGHSAARGGAVFNASSGNLTISDSLLIANSATGGGGGGIFNDLGTVTITNSSLNSNSASIGGALRNNNGTGTVSITDSVLNNNTSSLGGGGALSNQATMTVTNSLFTGNASGSGGAINNSSKLTITGGLFGNNSASSGGALHNSNTLTITSSTLSGNTASSNGGGIYNTSLGTCNVTGSTFTENTATQFGGGVHNLGTANITRSTLHGNSAAGGGGVATFTNGLTSLNTTTLSGNTASSGGGGAQVYSASMIVQNSTIAFNTASPGGGFAVLGTNPILLLENSIVSGNAGGKTGGPDISSATAIQLDFSAVGSALGFSFTGANNLPFGSNLKLGTLNFNGGLTETHSLLADSPAINAGDPADTSTDQRGFATNGIRDIGAFEVQVVTINPATLPGGTVGTAYNQTVTATAGTLPGGTTFTFRIDGGGLPNGLTLNPSGQISGTPTAASSVDFLVTAEASTGDSNSRLYTVTISAPANTPPTISNIANQTSTGAAVGPIAFTVGDAETPVANLTLSATSSNTTLIPNANVVFGGSGASRTVTVTPAAGQFGTSVITVTVTDGNGTTASDLFAVTVSLTANTPPTISNIPDQSNTGGTFGPISFIINDAETLAANLTLSGTSSNTALIPTGNVSFGGSGANRTVMLTPDSSQSGTSTITVTVTDGSGATASDTFVVTVTRSSLENEFSVGSDIGTESTVTLYNADKSVRFSKAPYSATESFTGGIRTAAGDFNGDGIADLAVGSGPGRAGNARVYDGVTQSVLFNISPFGDSFTRGIIVAAGDMNNDGLSDLIITAEAGGGARVRIFQSTGSGFAQRSDFIALIGSDNVPDSRIFRGGSRATVSDINGDGTGDLIWAAGAGGGPRIATFNGKMLNIGDNVNFKLTGDFFALGTNLRDGAYIAGGDVNGDGVGDLIAGGGSGAPPQVVGFSGATLIQNNFSKFLDFNFGTNSGQGIRVAVKDLNADNVGDVIVGSAPGAGSRVTAFNGKNLAGSNTGTAIFDFAAFTGFSGGVFVG